MIWKCHPQSDAPNALSLLDNHRGTTYDGILVA